MTVLARRAKGLVMKIVELAATPSTAATAAQLYALVLAGTRQLLAVDSDGQIYQFTPSFGPDRTSMYIIDDFLTTVGSIFSVSAATSSLTVSLAGSPGIQRSTITAVNSRVVITPNNVVITGIIVGGNPVFFEGRSRTPTVQDATDQWSDRFGLGDGTGGSDATDGCYFESDRAVNGDNNYRLCAANGGVRTKTTTGTAPTANTFERWKLIVNAAGNSIQGYRNDVAIGTPVTTNIPTAAATGVYWSVVVKTLGGVNARDIDRDYLETYQMFSAPRT